MNTRHRCIAGILGAGTLLMAACSGDDPAPTPTATTPTAITTATSTPTASATPSLEELQAEVEAAYLAHWDAYADAVLELDATLAEPVTGGDELDAIREEIDQLQSDGVALRVVVEHDFQVIEVDPTAAVVIDELVSNSFYVDAVTKLPEQGEGSGERFRYVTYLERVNGRWVVVRTEQGS